MYVCAYDHVYIISVEWPLHRYSDNIYSDKNKKNKTIIETTSSGSGVVSPSAQLTRMRHTIVVVMPIRNKVGFSCQCVLCMLCCHGLVHLS